MALKTAAVVLAAGNGTRMGGGTKKQYLLLDGFPVLFYSLNVFQESFLDEIVLVAPEADLSYCRTEIVERYGFSKVKKLVPGGAERYHSVLCGLRAIKDCDYVFIHDAARPLLTSDILERAFAEVQKSGACVVGMPSKDTVKLATPEGNVASTPDRSTVWTVQTPQAFRYDLIYEAYRDVVSRDEQLKAQGLHITDDAMVLETYSGHRIRLVPGSYENIKVTTAEDLILAEALLKARTGRSTADSYADAAKR